MTTEDKELEVDLALQARGVVFAPRLYLSCSKKGRQEFSFLQDGKDAHLVKVLDISQSVNLEDLSVLELFPNLDVLRIAGATLSNLSGIERAGRLRHFELSLSRKARSIGMAPLLARSDIQIHETRVA